MARMSRRQLEAEAIFEKRTLTALNRAALVMSDEYQERIEREAGQITANVERGQWAMEIRSIHAVIRNGAGDFLCRLLPVFAQDGSLQASAEVAPGCTMLAASFARFMNDRLERNRLEREAAAYSLTELGQMALAEVEGRGQLVDTAA